MDVLTTFFTTNFATIIEKLNVCARVAREKCEIKMREVEDISNEKRAFVLKVLNVSGFGRMGVLDLV